MIEEVVLNQVKKHNSYLFKAYEDNVWSQNPKAILKIKEEKFQDILQDSDFINFARMSNDFLKNLNLNVIIYDESGQKLFSNQEIPTTNIKKYNKNLSYNRIFLYLDQFFLQDYMSKNPAFDAFKGKTVHSLVSRALVTDEYNQTHEGSFINSYIPIIDSSMGKFTIDGVVEITTDITEQWDNIIYLEKRAFIAFLIVFLIFFIIVMYNTNYAQRVINKQFEDNKTLVESKAKAEMENSSKTEFLANISHELRTPLNAIIGFSEIILTETYGKIANNQYADYIKDINSSGNHLLSVINDILDFSKASADKLSVNKMDLDLNKLAAASLRFVKPRADSASIQLIEDMPKAHVIINADPKRLKQALLNLLSNSVKFTPADGSVTLSIKQDIIQKIVYIIVSDTGIGMSDKDIPKALSSFGQVDNTLGRKYEGTGLGLPLTKKLIELMHGHFDIQSKEGKGTTVTISFPYTESIEL